MKIYEDEMIVAVNKPAGTPVQSGKDLKDSLVSNLEREYGKIYVVHRIDTPVSGIVLFARTKRAASDLSRQFSERRVVKRYLAASTGSLPDEAGRLEDFIHVPSGRKANKVYIRSESSAGTKKAVLTYRKIYRTDHYNIYEIILETGRKHQIRAQLAARGAAVKGDIKYGARRTNPGGGIHLHALSIEFRHPGNGRNLKIEAPLPEDPVWNSVPLKVLSSASEQPQIPE